MEWTQNNIILKYCKLELKYFKIWLDWKTGSEHSLFFKQ